MTRPSLASLPRWFFLACIQILTATCQLSDLVTPNGPGRLGASPTAVSDSAPVGSTSGRSQRISITTNGGSGVGWRATVSSGSQWLALGSAQDTAPASLDVTLKPTGLQVGMYQDTIVLTGDRVDDVVRIPVSFAIQAGSPQRPPESPSNLGQFRIDGTTSIPVGGVTTEQTVVLRARVTDPEPGDMLRLEAEVQPIGIPFSNVPNAVSVAVPNGATASASATGLSDYTSYHWQARTSDRAGATSAWVSFGGNAESEADFRVALPPTRLIFLTDPSNAGSGAAITPAVRVAVQDAGGSTLSYFTGNITLVIASNPSAGALGGTTTRAAVNGIATFGDLWIDKAGSGYTLAASSTGLPSVTSRPFDITGGTGSRLAFTVQPSNAAAGTAISPAIRVTALDAAGNTATGFAGPITIAIANNPGAGTLAGTTSVAATGGVATFGDLSINRAGTGYTLRASAAGLTAATSAAFNVNGGTVSASQSTVSAAPASIVASAGGVTATVTVTVRDASGNVLAGTTVAVAASGTGNTLTPVSGLTNASGVFNAALSSTVAGPKTISATGGGVPLTQTAAVTVTAAPASRLTFTAQPTSVAVAAPITPPVQVTALDPFGNVAAFGGAVTVAIAANPSGGILSGTLTVTATNGVATFGNLMIDRAGIGYTLQATATGLTAGTSGLFNATGTGPVSAAQSAVAASPASIEAGTGSSAITVTIRDAAGTPIGGAGVTVLATGTGNNIAPASGTTSATGVFTAAFSSTVAEAKTVSATANSVAITQTATITVTAPPPPPPPPPPPSPPASPAR